MFGPSQSQLLAESDRIRELESQLAERDQQLASAEGALELLGKQAAEVPNILAERDRQLLAVTHRLAVRDQQLGEAREDGERFTLRQLQEEQAVWSQHNFGDKPTWMPLLGAVEELGELAHAHLKAAQGIRTNQDHEADGKDAVADVVIYLADYCSRMGWDMHSIVEETWAEVKQRDWKANPETGKPDAEA